MYRPIDKNSRISKIFDYLEHIIAWLFFFLTPLILPFFGFKDIIFDSSKSSKNKEKSRNFTTTVGDIKRILFLS